MRIAIVGLLAGLASGGLALVGASMSASAMDCYWDHAQRAQVCRPNHWERQEWRERQERRAYEGYRHYDPPGWHYRDDRGRW
jgi:hypothetical protein